MSHAWALQDAKARFSELLKRARSEGPQIVTYRGVEAAVVLSIEDYRRLEAGRPSFAEFLIAGPELDDDAVAVINERSGDVGRAVDF